MKFTRSLSFRLLTGIFVIMLAGVALLTFFLVNLQTERYLNSASQTAAGVSDIIKRSADYSMLLNRREDVYNIIKTIGSEPGIEGIRIYNKKGEISFSSQDNEIGKTVDINTEACIACHSSGNLSISPENKNSLVRYFNSTKGYRVIGIITPIKNEARCSSAECHAHPETQTVLGVLDVMIPLKEIDENIASFHFIQYSGGIILIIVVTVFTGLFVWRVVTIPVHKLTEGTEQITQGNLSHRIVIGTKDEIGLLTKSFNTMTTELHQTQKELTLLNQTLEKRVEEKTEELKLAQANMIQVEKMVSLGTLAATVAHELNNPLDGILTYSKVVKKQIERSPLNDETKNEITDELMMIANESARCGNIVKNLLLFSRKRVGELREHHISDLIQQTIKLMNHHFKMHNITVQTNFGNDVPPIMCDGQQIEQMLLALEINATETMRDEGTLTLSVHKENENIVLLVSDTGYGIRPEDIPHIFEPFFTTKKEGKGTGLGLAVVYGIIQRHGGAIAVQSAHNKGTTFIITLPMRPPAELENIL